MHVMKNLSCMAEISKQKIELLTTELDILTLIPAVSFEIHVYKPILFVRMHLYHQDSP